MTELAGPLQALPEPPRVTRSGKLLGKMLRRLWQLRGRDYYDDYRLERLQGTPILVIPSVFNPKRLRSGAFFAAQLDARRVPGHSEVLDLGTGSGICAIRAAAHARRVIAVDLNPAAVRCAALNALLNHFEQGIEVRHGDLFAPVSGERFDLVLFNPPFAHGTPRDERERAWRAPDVAERFAAGLGGHLKPAGSALVVLSSFGHAAHFLAAFHRHRLSVSSLAERSFYNERLVLYELRSEAARDS
jgi:release factor glutamine methyltransferase